MHSRLSNLPFTVDKSTIVPQLGGRLLGSGDTPLHGQIARSYSTPSSECSYNTSSSECSSATPCSHSGHTWRNVSPRAARSADPSNVAPDA